MNYLVTGGSGFIGTNLVNRLHMNPENTVKILDKELPRNEEYHWIKGDIEYDPIDTAFEDIDIVIHLACQPGVETSVKDPVGTFNQNVYGTLMCLEASRKAGVKRFIFASSGGTVLGKQDVPLNETLPPNPASPYGASKLACEGYCKSYYHTYGLESVILRFSNVYGPHSEHKGFNLISGFIMNAIENKSCIINGDGEINKDYIFVDDLVEAIIKAANVKQIAGETFQLAFGRAVSINEIKDILSKLSEKYLSRPLTVVYGDERVGDVTYSCDTSKANKILLFNSKYSLEDGLEKTFKWYMNNWRR